MPDANLNELNDQENTNKNRLCEYLHWKLQIKIKSIFEEMTQIQENIMNFTEEIYHMINVYN